MIYPSRGKTLNGSPFTLTLTDPNKWALDIAFECDGITRIVNLTQALELSQGFLYETTGHVCEHGKSHFVAALRNNAEEMIASCYESGNVFIHGLLHSRTTMVTFKHLNDFSIPQIAELTPEKLVRLVALVKEVKLGYQLLNK